MEHKPISLMCVHYAKRNDEKASLWPKQRMQLHHLEQTTLTALLGKFFIAKVYNTRALVWLPKTKEPWPLLMFLRMNASPKLKLFLQEHIVQGSQWCTCYFWQKVPASFSWAPPSPLLHSCWQQEVISPGPETSGSGFPPPEGQAVH